MILIAIILSAVISFFVLGTTYKSFTTVIVGRSNDSDIEISNEDIALNENLIDIYSVVIKSEPILDKVISNLKLNYTENKLKNKVIVNPVSETEIIEITAEITNDTTSVFMK